MNCKNCNTALLESHNYCSICGAKTIRNRLTAKNLFNDFSEQYFNFDNKFLQTFLHLFSRPEVVIDGYISGTRKKYVNAISYFAIALTLSGLQLFILNKFFPEVLDVSSITANGTEDLQRKNLEFVQEYQSLVMMLYLPFYALISKTVFFDIKKYNYTEHMVMFMYILSQTTIISAFITILLAAFGVDLGIISFGFVMPFQIVYSAFVLKRIFALNVSKILLKTVLFFLVLLVLLIVLSVLMFAIMYFTGGLQQTIEAQRAAREASGS